MYKILDYLYFCIGKFNYPEKTFNDMNRTFIYLLCAVCTLFLISCNSKQGEQKDGNNNVVTENVDDDSDFDEGEDLFSEEGIDEEEEEEVKPEGGTDKVTFASILRDADWLDSGYGFKYPDFMEKSETFDGEVPTTFECYTWRSAQLSYFFAGNWATFTENFPVAGCRIAPETEIREVTYSAEKKGIFSGYVADGRIFYLKRVIVEDEVPHAAVLALIYPKAMQDNMERLIEEVQRFKK